MRKRIILIVCIAVAVLLVGTLILAAALKKSGISQNDKAQLEDPDTIMIADADLGDTIAAPEQLDDYKLVGESKNYALYLFEDTMSIRILNKATDVIYESTLSDERDDGTSNKTWRATMQSGINITAIKGDKDTYMVNLVGDKNTISYEYIDNGFIATMYFTAYEFGLSVQVILDGDSLVATVPEETIVEKKASNYICTVSLFPYLGYTWMDEEDGYMLVPDGNGALIYLDDKDGQYSSGFSQMIYGRDDGFDDTLSVSTWNDYVAVNAPEKVLAPVFGMAHLEEQSAFLGIVEKGEERASIEAQPNGVTVNYNRCYARFFVRKIYVQPLNNSNSGTQIMVESDRTHSDLQVRFILLSGENATYTGMAVAYREYLKQNGMLTESDTKYRTRVDFLGIDNEEWLVFTSSVTMTTADQIDEIYKELRQLGVESLLTVYKGWQDGGIYDLPIKKYKAAGEIGGTGSLTDLIESSAENDYKLYLYVNALLANPDENNTTFNTIKKINKRRLELLTYGKVYEVMNYLVPSKAEGLLSGLVAGMAKKGVSTVALAGITDTIFSFTYNGNKYTRRDTQEVFYRMVSETAKTTDLILESPCAYLWNQTDAFLDMPLESSHYMYLDEEVPFLSIVLKGTIPMYSDYVNLEANKNEFFLRLVESGVYPSFYLTYEDSADLIYTNSADLYSTLYTTYLGTVAEYDAALRALAEQVEGACIIDHKKYDNGITRVEYDNGAVIYINYSEQTVTMDGYTVDAMSYVIGKK